MILDAGALIAADRGDRRFYAWWKLATGRGEVAIAPSPVIAQAWRGPRCARLARVLSGCQSAELDRPTARRVGELCGQAGTSDVVDAFVVLLAVDRGDDILTSDPADLRYLAGHVAGVGRILRLADLGGP